jgi:hypothetical protein
MKWHNINCATRGVVLLLPMILACGAGAQTAVNVVTGQYDNFRSGSNPSETILTPANVAAATFGMLFAQPVDQTFYAQPLYVQGLTIDNQVHNVVFVATVNDTVYAFDADSAQPALWSVSLGTPAVVEGGANIGILSTPVADLSSNTLFVAALADEGGASVYRLHALNLPTGTEIANVVIQAAVAGTGDDSQTAACTSGNGGTVPPPCIPFVAAQQFQRPALLEDTANVIVYLAFGSAGGEESARQYHGWVMGYSYANGTFTQSMAFNTTQNATQSGPACSGVKPATNQCGHGGGIWMSGRGPALDNTGIYVVVGNGGYGGTGTGNWGESALLLNGSGAVDSSFTPAGYASLNQHDLDLGDAGGILFPSTNAAAPNLMLAVGKTGNVYVLNRANLGGLNTGNTGAVQVFTGSSKGCGTGPGLLKCYEIHNPALWAPGSANPTLYLWGYGDVLQVWDFNQTTNHFARAPNQGTVTAANYPGGALAVSSNGAGNGIVWGIAAITNTSPGQGALYAFNAINVSQPLFVSTDYWFSTKFTTPTVANGKVYVPTSGSPAGVTPAYGPQLVVYGLCASCPAPQGSGRKR